MPPDSRPSASSRVSGARDASMWSRRCPPSTGAMRRRGSEVLDLEWVQWWTGVSGPLSVCWPRQWGSGISGTCPTSSMEMPKGIHAQSVDRI